MIILKLTVTSFRIYNCRCFLISWFQLNNSGKGTLEKCFVIFNGRTLSVNPNDYTLTFEILTALNRNVVKMKQLSSPSQSVVTFSSWNRNKAMSRYHNSFIYFWNIVCRDFILYSVNNKMLCAGMVRSLSVPDWYSHTGNQSLAPSPFTGSNRFICDACLNEMKSVEIEWMESQVILLSVFIVVIVPVALLNLALGRFNASPENKKLLFLIGRPTLLLWVYEFDYGKVF